MAALRKLKTLTNLLIDHSLLFSLHTHSKLYFQSFINFLFPRFRSDYNVISAIILSCNAHLIIFTCILGNINIKLVLNYYYYYYEINTDFMFLKLFFTSLSNTNWVSILATCRLTGIWQSKLSPSV